MVVAREGLGEVFRVGARGSRLARVQARLVIGALEGVGGGRMFDYVAVRTEGDERSGAVKLLGGKGLFTARLDEALREGRCRFGVHSLKDVPTFQGLQESGEREVVLAAVLARGNPCDVLVCRADSLGDSLGGSDGTDFTDSPDSSGGLSSLRLGAVVGTSSPRRAAWLRYLRADLEVVGLRGNVPTRLDRLAEGGAGGEMDAVVLAAAGLERLGCLPAGLEASLEVAAWHGLEFSGDFSGGLFGRVLSVAEFLPAACQGVIGVCVLGCDAEAMALARLLDDFETRHCIEIE
ncbi:MAG: hypothetical protein OD811_04090, partial [Alphaproteobacteria bacterium]